MKTPKKAAPQADKPKVPVTTKAAPEPKPDYKWTELGHKGGEFYSKTSGAAAEPATNLGDWDQNGKSGGDAKALGTEPRPMPKDFAPTITVEGARVVARQDGIEVPFINTEDKKHYAEQAQQQRQTLWRELERVRIRGLKA